MADRVQVKAVGLAEFRRDVRRADKEVGKELQADLRSIAQQVARGAAVLAPGRIAESYRGTARGTRGIVRSSFLPSRFLEFGFHPGGGETFVEGRNFIGRALEAQEDRIVDAIGDAVEKTATKLGWH